ncbi:F-box/WD repeat-containing protein 9 [Austrofundulus limnaeus]|uniref:F-box/WD repeat-containing protein 9 n=1 Tax=Austrofundulus limnaeus TaxID=52670 RepID=A0A2I4BJQ0_AUSLI|nr:PREDICTED: F-box/WD repeat-containing protein 9 [Austrofundulus limnaeus]
MSEVKVNLTKAEAGTQDDPAGPRPDPVRTTCTDGPDLQGSSSTDVSPSPSAEPSSLLSLPWEILTNIASYLPAQCVINVLPKVCHLLSTVSEDSTAWQLRAQRLIGSKASFPVGPREDFDWPAACLEIEKLITFWTGEAQHKARQTQAKEEERDRVRLRGPVEEEQDAAGEEELQEVGGPAQEVAYGADEGVEVVVEAEDGEMPPDIDGDQLARLRIELEDRLGDGAGELMEDGRMALNANGGQDAGLLDQNNFMNWDNEEQADVINQQVSRRPSPPPALECITLPISHITKINSVLFLDREGGVCATASRDWNVKVWDVQAGSNGTLLYTLGRQGDFSSHRGWVWCLASKGPLLASGGFDSTVRLWDLQAGGADRGLIRTGAAVLCLSYQPDVLLAGTFDKSISMYDTRAAEPLIKSLRLHGNAVLCLAADDKYIISGSHDCTVAVYDRRAGKRLKKTQLRSYLLSMSYSGSEVWAGDNRGLLHSFSMQAGSLKLLSQFDVGHTALVTGIHRSLGSLYSCSSDGTVKVHIPCAPPRTLCTLNYPACVHGMSVEDGVLALASGEGIVDVWRPRK